MDIKTNTQQVNSFAGGMNTDLSDMLIKSDQYRLAKNVRYVTNDEENGGELRMIDGCVFGGSLLYGFSIQDVEQKVEGYTNDQLLQYSLKVLYTGSIREYAIAIIKSIPVKNCRFLINDPLENIIECNEQASSKWWLLVSKNPFDGVDNDTYKEMDAFKVAFGPCGETIGDKPSVVCRYENYNNVHVYIADGINPVLSINIGHVYDNNFVPSTDYNSITSNPTVTFERIWFKGFVDGSLPAGVIEYSYQYYNKYGNESKISAPTKLIPISKGSGNSTEGYNVGDRSDKGVKLQMPGKHKSFDSMRIYRIEYIESGQLPTIDVVYESQVVSTGSWIYIDSGQQALYNITLEEYNANSGIHIIPKILESKGDYLFAANIKKDIDSFVSQEILDWDARAYRPLKDGSIKLYTYGTEDYITVDSSTYDVPTNHDCWQPINDINSNDQLGKYLYEGVGKNISWYFETINVVGDSNKTKIDGMYGQIGSTGDPIDYNESNKLSYYNASGSVYNTIRDQRATYVDPVVSYTCKSLRRDELYRFGIILYDNKGNASPVKWIADIRTPTISESPTFTPHSDGRDLIVHPLGVTFLIDYYSLYNIGVTSYEIVRCARSESDIKNLSQGVLSRSLKKEVNKYNSALSEMQASYPYTPSGWLTTADYWAGTSRVFEFQDRTNDEEKQWWSESNARLPYVDSGKTYYNEANTHVFQFVSPEVCYEQEQFKQLLSQQTLKLKLATYLYGFGTRENGFDHAENSDILIQSSIREVTQPWTYSNIFANQVLYPGNKYTKMYVENTGMYMYQVESSGNSSVVVSGTFAKFDEDNLKHVITCTSYIAPLFYYGDSPLQNCVRSSNASVNIDGKTYKAHSVSDQYADSNTVYQKNDVDSRHQYIKLYQKSDDIVGRTFLNGIPIGGVGTLVKTDSLDEIKVEDFAFANTYQWDDFAETKKSGETYPLKYITQQTSIGEYSFVNWVSGGAYNVPVTGDWGTLRLDDAGYQKNMMGQTNVVMGPGGACMLLNLSDAPIHIITSVAAKYTNAPYVSPATTFGDYQVIPESRLGTFLCNITHTITPYAGFSYENRKQDTYYSCGEYFTIDQETQAITGGHTLVRVNSVAGTMCGDCYIQPMEYISQHKYYFAPNKYTKNACIVYAIPVESSINMAYTSGAEFRRTRSAETQETPADVYRKYTQTKSLYKYNPVYSQGNKVNPKGVQLDRDDYDVQFDTRCFYSNPKSNNEKSDSWLKFMPANFIDVDTRKGPITNLRTFNNQLMFWQTDGIGILSVDEKATVTDQTNMPLLLGTGGILSRFDYINAVFGMKENEFCDAQSDSTLFWWDHTRKELCAYAGGNEVMSLSKSKSVQNLINTKVKQDLLANDPHLIYDKKYNELIAYIATTKSDVEKDGAVQQSEEQALEQYTATFPIQDGVVQIRMIHPTADDDMPYYKSKYISNFNCVVEGTDATVILFKDDSQQATTIPTAKMVGQTGIQNSLRGIFVDMDSTEKTTWSKHVADGNADEGMIVVITFTYVPYKKKEDQDVQPDDPSDQTTNTDDGSLIFSELTGTFQSLVDVYPKHHMTFGDKIYMLSDKDKNQQFLWLWNYQECKKDPSVKYVRGFSDILYPYVKYIVNDNSTLPKVFDNVSFGGRFYGGDNDTKDPYTGNVTTIDGGIKDIVFEFKTPLKQHGKLTGKSIENREYDFRFSVPRNNDSAYGDRLRGKTMQCEMYSTKSDIDFSLQYITTKYRISWI